FGHHASLIKVTERKFTTSPADSPLAGSPVAYLRQHMYIVVRQPELTYARGVFVNGGREMPFKTVRLTTLVTPDILDPADLQTFVGIPDPKAKNNRDTEFSWITVLSGRFRFHVHATDWHGHDVDFTTPLIFMLGGQSQARMKELWPDRIQRYDQVLSTPASDVSIGLQGQRFTYADPQPGSDTT